MGLSTQCTQGPAAQSSRVWLLETLRSYFSRMSQEERHVLAAELGIQPVFNIQFVDPEAEERRL
jgi:hypothetical protein